MIRPVVGRVTQKFGTKNPAYRLGYHPGTDYAASNGNKGRAEEDGYYRYLPGLNGGYGNVGAITLRNGDVIWNAHLKRTLVKNGPVKEGHVIFETDSTGWADGPHIHVEYRVKGSQNRPIDFEKVLAASKKKKPRKPRIYVVRLGDNLSTIARRLKTSLKVLLQKNTQYKKNPDLIKPGQKIKY